MRRLAFLPLAVALACGSSSAPDPGPLDEFYKPSGLAVHGGNLLVASSNFDLRYGLEDGGTIISVNPRASVDPAKARLVSGVRIASYSGELAVLDVADCGTAGLDQSLPPLTTGVAVVASRAAKALYPVAIGAGGALSCDGCAISLASASYADPLAVGVACTGSFARAYVAYLRSFDGRGWISEHDLVDRSLPPRSAEVANGPVRGLAFDRRRERLWMTAMATGSASQLKWLELGGGCRFDLPGAEGGCPLEAIPSLDLPAGLELRGIALSNVDPAGDPAVRRAYLTGRLYDVPSASVAGGRTTDYGGLLLAVDLVEDPAGLVDAHVASAIRLGTGAADVKVLPPRGSGVRDVVAALDGTALTIYDDETGTVRTFGADPVTGAPVLGHVPWGIAVDPVVAAGIARLYVGSFDESHVTAIDVPLADPAGACMVPEDGTCIGVMPPPPPSRISGRLTP